MGFEEGFRVWSMDMDMESLHGLMVNFAKENFVRGQRKGKGEFKWADRRICKGEWKTWKQYGFSIKAMQNSKSRFLHGSNGFPIKANEKSSRGKLSCLNTGKLLVKLNEEMDSEQDQKNSLPGSNLIRDLLFPF